MKFESAIKFCKFADPKHLFGFCGLLDSFATLRRAVFLDAQMAAVEALLSAAGFYSGSTATEHATSSSQTDLTATKCYAFLI